MFDKFKKFGEEKTFDKFKKFGKEIPQKSAGWSKFKKTFKKLGSKFKKGGKSKFYDNKKPMMDKFRPY